MALTDNLVAHWKLDETSGTRVDSHGSHDLSETAEVGYAAGKIGNAASFPDSETSFLYRESIASDLQLGDTDFTVACWAKVSSHGGMLLRWHGSLDDFVLATRYSDSDLVVAVWGWDYGTETTFSTNTWHLVIVTFTAADNTLRVYQDNNLLIAPTVTPPSSEEKLVVGDDFRHEGDRYVDSVSFWKRVLTSDERAELWNGGAGLDYDDWLTLEADGSAAVTVEAEGTPVITTPATGQAQITLSCTSTASVVVLATGSCAVTVGCTGEAHLDEAGVVNAVGSAAVTVSGAAAASIVTLAVGGSVVTIGASGAAQVIEIITAEGSASVVISATGAGTVYDPSMVVEAGGLAELTLSAAGDGETALGGAGSAVVTIGAEGAAVVEEPTSIIEGAGSATVTVSAAADTMETETGAPYWFKGPSVLGFTRAVEVVAKTTPEPSSESRALMSFGESFPAEETGGITSRPMIKLARAVNDRLRSGLGDCPWRIVYYVLGLFREMRNPSADGYQRPALAEFFESYQPLVPEDGDWPVNGPGEPEGSNVNSPLGGYLFGNESAGLDSEAAMLDAIPTKMPDGSDPVTMADQWSIKKRQMGASDPVTGAQVAPAIEAARHWGAVRYSRSSWHLTSYGGWLPTPDLLETPCDDPDEFDGYPAPPNREIKFAATEAGAAAGYSDRTYAGTCRVGPAISPADKYDDHVLAVVESPWAYFVVLNGGTVETLPRWAYVEGPYTGPPQLRKVTGDQLARALARAAVDWRGSRQDATARSAMDAGAADRPNTWLVGAFNAQGFLSRQYVLAPALGRAVEGGVEAEYPGWRWDAPAGDPGATAGTVVPPVGPEDHHTVAEGAAVRHLYLGASGLIGSVRVAVEVDGVQLVVCALSTSAPGDIVALPSDAEAGATIRLRFLSGATFAEGGHLEAEAAQQIAYKPDLSDLICVLRRSGPDQDARQYDLGSEVSAQLDRFGMLAPPFSGEAPAYPSHYTGHPVYEAARRWSQVVRIIPRRQLVGYAVEDGRSVLWFRRRAVGMGGQVHRVEVLQGTGGIVPGQEYVVEGDPGDDVQYPQTTGPIIEPGGHFVGTADDDDFLTNGTPRVYAVTSGILDQAMGADLFAGIAEQIAHDAPPGGHTNEWLLGVQLKPYHTSQSSIWKPEAHSDRFPLNDRCTFYSPEIVNEIDRSKLWHAAYGLGIGGLTNGGNLISEWPTGWRYAPLTSAWSGRQFLNSITVDGVWWPDTDARNDFYRSARIYEPDLDVLSCEAVTEGSDELVKVTLTGRLHNTYGQPGGAPASVDRDMAGWDADAVAAEPFETSETALRKYLLHASTGRNFGPVIGDNAANSRVQELPDNPFGSIFPHIYMVRCVPEPYEDGNEEQDPQHDTPCYHDPLAIVDLYVEAMVGGFVDQQQSTEKLLQWVEANEGVLPESWGLHDYTRPALCQQADGTAWTGIVSTEAREDNPHGFGPFPKTAITAEVFNRLVHQVNRLNKVRLMIPYTYEVRQDGYIGRRVSEHGIEISMTGNVSVWVDNAQWPGAGTPDPGSTVDWAESSSALSLATGALGAIDIGGGTIMVTEDNASVTSEWRVTLADGIENAFPPFVRDLYDGSHVSAIVWYERTRTNYTRTAVPYEESETVDGNLGWYTSGGEYYAWLPGPIQEAEEWAGIADAGRVVAEAPPASDAGLGRSAGMPSETFEAEGVGQSSLQAYFLPGATLCLTVPLVD